MSDDEDFYKNIELAWLKWYIGIAWATRKEEEE